MMMISNTNVEFNMQIIYFRVKGKESVFKLSAEIGWAHLETDIERMGSDSRFSSLVWELGLEDPDEAFSSVPYEKVYF